MTKLEKDITRIVNHVWSTAHTGNVSKEMVKAIVEYLESNNKEENDRP